MHVVPQTPAAPPLELLLLTTPSLTLNRRTRRQPEPITRFDLLGLEGLVTIDEPVARQCTVEITAEQIRQPTYPDCSCRNKAVKAHSPFKQTILDVPQGRMQRYVKLRRRRWRCKSCGVVVTQPLTCLAPGRYLMAPGGIRRGPVSATHRP